MKHRSVKKKNVTTPMEVATIFYDEALRISGNRADATKLAKEAVADFLLHYRFVVKSRTNGHMRF